MPSLKGAVKQPSSISTFVFVMDSEEAALVLGPSGVGRVAYEELCDGEVCMEITTALYVSKAVLESPSELAHAMVIGLGIYPTGGEFPEGHPPDWHFTPK